MNKNSRRTEATKQDLQDAFMRLYAEKDIQSISIKDITDLAGYHRGTFYRYYLDIYDLFDRIKKDLLIEFTQMAETIISKTKGVMCTETVTIMMDFYNRNEKYMMTLMNRDGTMVQSLMDVMRPVFFSKMGELSPDAQREMNYMLEYHFAGVINAISRWGKNRKDISQEELMEVIYQVANNGILSILREKGVF